MKIKLLHLEQEYTRGPTGKWTRFQVGPIEKKMRKRMLNYFVFGRLRRALKIIFYRCPAPSTESTDLTVNNNPGAAVWCGRRGEGLQINPPGPQKA